MQPIDSSVVRYGIHTTNFSLEDDSDDDERFVVMSASSFLLEDQSYPYRQHDVSEELRTQKQHHLGWK